MFKKYSCLIYGFLYMTFGGLPLSVSAQQTQGYAHDSRLAFSVILSSPTRFNIKAHENYFNRDLQKDLFYGNAFIGLQADYLFREHWAISPSISLSRSRSSRDNSIVFFIAPPPGSITHFNTDYHFFNASFKPKIRFSLDYYKVTFFWAAGPVISYASLSSHTDGAPYNNPDALAPFSSSKSHVFGIGGTALTGLQYKFIKHVNIRLQLTYQYIHFPDFILKIHTLNKGTISYDYGLNTLSPGVVFTYNL